MRQKWALRSKDCFSLGDRGKGVGRDFWKAHPLGPAANIVDW